MTLKRTIWCLAAAACAGLTGCSSITISEVPPSLCPEPEDAQNKTFMYAEGVQRFECDQDADGYYWKFVQTEAGLFQIFDATAGILPSQIGYRMGTLTATPKDGQKFVHQDGSYATSAKVITNMPVKGKNDISWMLVKTDPSSLGLNKELRTFDSVHYVTRMNTKGGMPLSACEKSSLGSEHESKFSAVYVFWR